MIPKTRTRDMSSCPLKLLLRGLCGETWSLIKLIRPIMRIGESNNADRETNSRYILRW